MKKLIPISIALSALCSSVGMQAQETDDALRCKLSTVRPGDRFSAVSSDLTWFISAHPTDINTVGIIYSLGGNYLYQYEEPGNPTSIDERQVSVPGDVDPVFTPDGLFVTTPLLNFSFIRVDDVMQNGELIHDVEARVALEDEEMPGAYQSVGLLEATDEVRVYRAIIEAGPLLVKDYTFRNEGGEFVFASDTDVKFLCGENSEAILKTPKISKTGKYLAAYDVNAQATKIFELESGGEQCREIPGIDLGIHTGKIDFNADDTRIAFHVSRQDTGNIGELAEWTATIASNEKRDVYVVDLVKEAGVVVGNGKMTRVSKRTTYGEGAWYPSFSGTDHISYMTQFPDFHTNRLINGLVRVDLNEQHSEEYAYLYSSDTTREDAKEAHAIHLIAGLAQQSCFSNPGTSNWDGRTFDEALSDVTLLGPDLCQQLVDDHWDAKREAVLGTEAIVGLTGSRLDADLLQSITKDDLLAACPSRIRTTSIASENVSIGDEGEPDGTALLKSRCSYCHFPGNDFTPEINFDDPEKLPLDYLTLSIHAMEHTPQPELFESFSEEQFLDSEILMPNGITMSDTNRSRILCYLYKQRKERFPISRDVPLECVVFEDPADIIYFENTTETPLTDAGETVSTINVDLDTSELVDISFVVEINIRHEYVGDLEVVLVSPSGTEMVLIEGSNNDRTRILEHFTEIEELIDEPLNGEWSLRITDQSQGDTGSLIDWSLRRLP